MKNIHVILFYTGKNKGHREQITNHSANVIMVMAHQCGSELPGFSGQMRKLKKQEVSHPIS